MPYGLVNTSPPAAEPVSVATLASHLRLASAIQTQDASLLAIYITTARTLLEVWTQRAFVTQSWTLTIDSWDHHHRQYAWPYGFGGSYQYTLTGGTNWWRQPLQLPMSPLQSVTSITYTDTADATQTLSSATYSVDTAREPGRILFTSFPSLSSDRLPPISIAYTVGYGAAGAVPVPLQHAILLLTADFYRSREATTELSLSDIPMGLKGLIGAYKVGEAASYGL